jgi:hypothetical protein
MLSLTTATGAELRVSSGEIARPLSTGIFSVSSEPRTFSQTSSPEYPGM